MTSEEAVATIKSSWDIELLTDIMPQHSYPQRIKDYPQTWSTDLLKELWRLSRITAGQQDEVQAEMQKAFHGEKTYISTTAVARLATVYERFSKEHTAQGHTIEDEPVQIIVGEARSKPNPTRTRPIVSKHAWDQNPARASNRSTTTSAQRSTKRGPQTNPNHNPSPSPTSSLPPPKKPRTTPTPTPTHPLLPPPPAHLTPAQRHALTLLQLQLLAADRALRSAELDVEAAQDRRTRVFTALREGPGEVAGVDAEVVRRRGVVEERYRDVYRLRLRVAELVGVEEFYGGRGGEGGDGGEKGEDGGNEGEDGGDELV